MQQQTVTLTDPDLAAPVVITVQRATVQADIKRSRLETEARQSGQADPDLLRASYHSQREPPSAPHRMP